MVHGSHNLWYMVVITYGMRLEQIQGYGGDSLVAM